LLQFGHLLFLADIPFPLWSMVHAIRLFVKL